MTQTASQARELGVTFDYSSLLSSLFFIKKEDPLILFPKKIYVWSFLQSSLLQPQYKDNHSSVLDYDNYH